MTTHMHAQMKITLSSHSKMRAGLVGLKVEKRLSTDLSDSPSRNWLHVM